MNRESIQAAFEEFWEDSYGRPPMTHATMTHVAFGEYLMRLVELYEESVNES